MTLTNALEDFFGPANTIKPTEVSPELQAVIENWQVSIAKGRVGFLPRSAAGRVYWYAFAPTPRGRRELLELLDGWIGPTYSDLAKTRGSLDDHDPFDQALIHLAVPPLRFEVLPRSGNLVAKARTQVRDSLQILSRLIDRRPASEFDAPRTTVEVLDDLGHAISAQDRGIALACLRELEVTADLDHINLTFLRLRLLSGLGDWAGVLSDQDLPHVLSMRRPLGVTRTIQLAVYQEYLASADIEGRDADLLRAAQELPQPFVALRTDAKVRSRAQAVVEFLLALRTSRPQSTLDRLVDEAELVDHSLAERLRGLLPQVTTEPPPVLDAPAGDAGTPEPLTLGPKVQQVVQLFSNGEWRAATTLGLTLVPDAQVAGILLSCARSLDEATTVQSVSDWLPVDLRAKLLSGNPQQRADVEWLEGFGSFSVPLTWRAWFEKLSDDSDPSAWDIDEAVSADWDALDRQEVANLLGQGTDEVLGRFGERGGPFMAAHRDLFSAEGAAGLSERVLAGLAISEKNSEGVRVQTLALLDHLVIANPTAELLASALEWTSEIVAANISAVSATWCVDVLQTATSGPAAVALPGKHTFFFALMEALRPFKSALDLTDLAALDLISGELGVQVPDDFRSSQDPDTDASTPFRYLEGQSVVLYSLTESATTRAAQILRTLLPGLDVQTTAEHDGSQKLNAMSANADVFVMVTASAKHAATNAIKAARGSKPTIHVNSRGTSAILRALCEG